MASLDKIRVDFENFRKKRASDKKRPHYPPDLLEMVYLAKEAGLSYSALSEASKMSVGGVEKAVRRFRQAKDRPAGAKAKMTPAAGKGLGRKPHLSHLLAADAATRASGKTVQAGKAAGKAGAKAKAKVGLKTIAKATPKATTARPAAPKKAAPKKAAPKKAAPKKAAPKGAAPNRAAVSPVAHPKKAAKKIPQKSSPVGHVEVVVGGQSISGSPKDIAAVLQSFKG